MFLWFYYYKHTTALPHPGNPGPCMLYLPSLLYLDRAIHKCPSLMSARETFDRAVQLIAYNDTISPAVKELYKNCARTPHDAGLLDSCFGSSTNFCSLFQSTWHRQEIPCLGEVLSGSDCQAVTPRSLHVVGLQPRLGGPKNSKYISPSSPNLPKAQISLWCSPCTVKCDIWFQKRSVSLANGEKLARSCRSAFFLRFFALVLHPL